MKTLFKRSIVLGGLKSGSVVGAIDYHGMQSPCYREMLTARQPTVAARGPPRWLRDAVGQSCITVFVYIHASESNASILVRVKQHCQSVQLLSP